MRRAQRLARRGKLLGLAPLGQGQGGSVEGPDQFGAPPYYLINDTFSTDRAAGAVNGTDAEPGPGRRTAVDANGKLSLSGGNAVFASDGVGSGNPALGYGTLSRETGRLIKASVIYDVQIGFQVGFDTDATGFIWTNINASGANLRTANGAVTINVGTVAAGNTYTVCVVLRAIGMLAFVKGGVYANWTLIWVWGNESAALLYPRIGVNSAANNWRSEFFRVPATLWLPTPLASDGFSVWGTTDGAGHAEGIAGGLGAGGGGLAWTQQVGTWAASGGVANASALSGGVAMATVNTGKADVIATTKLTRVGGNNGVMVRYVDANNLVGARHTGTNAQMFKVVGGVSTTLVDVASTYVVGAEIRVICEGQKFRLFYNNLAIGAEQTIADAALQSGTRQGLRTTDVGNTFDDFVVYARGTGGEYAALDAF